MGFCISQLPISRYTQAQQRLVSTIKVHGALVVELILFRENTLTVILSRARMSCLQKEMTAVTKSIEVSGRIVEKNLSNMAESEDTYIYRSLTTGVRVGELSLHDRNVRKLQARISAFSHTPTHSLPRLFTLRNLVDIFERVIQRC